MHTQYIIIQLKNHHSQNWDYQNFNVLGGQLITSKIEYWIANGHKNHNKK